MQNKSKLGTWYKEYDKRKYNMTNLISISLYIITCVLFTKELGYLHQKPCNIEWCKPLLKVFYSHIHLVTSWFILVSFSMKHFPYMLYVYKELCTLYIHTEITKTLFSLCIDFQSIWSLQNIMAIISHGS